MSTDITEKLPVMRHDDNTVCPFIPGEGVVCERRFFHKADVDVLTLLDNRSSIVLDRMDNGKYRARTFDGPPDAMPLDENEAEWGVGDTLEEALEYLTGAYWA